MKGETCKFQCIAYIYIGDPMFELQKGKVESTGNDSYFRSLNKDHGATPCSGK